MQSYTLFLIPQLFFKKIFSPPLFFRSIIYGNAPLPTVWLGALLFCAGLFIHP